LERETDLLLERIRNQNVAFHQQNDMIIDKFGNEESTFKSYEGDIN